jgi:hypothetical protein
MIDRRQNPCSNWGGLQSQVWKSRESAGIKEQGRRRENVMPGTTQNILFYRNHIIAELPKFIEALYANKL